MHSKLVLYVLRLFVLLFCLCLFHCFNLVASLLDEQHLLCFLLPFIVPLHCSLHLPIPAATLTTPILLPHCQTHKTLIFSFLLKFKLEMKFIWHCCVQ